MERSQYNVDFTWDEPKFQEVTIFRTIQWNIKVSNKIWMKFRERCSRRRKLQHSIQMNNSFKWFFVHNDNVICHRRETIAQCYLITTIIINRIAWIECNVLRIWSVVIEYSVIESKHKESTKHSSNRQRRELID